jgi:hypothetical protein
MNDKDIIAYSNAGVKTFFKKVEEKFFNYDEFLGCIPVGFVI